MRTRDGYLRKLLSNHRHLAVSCIHAHALSVSHSLFTQDMNRAGPHFSAHRSSHPHTKPPCITSIGAAPCHSCHIAGPWGCAHSSPAKAHRAGKSSEEQTRRPEIPQNKVTRVQGAGWTTPSLTTCSPQGAQSALNRRDAGRWQKKNSIPPLGVTSCPPPTWRYGPRKSML